MFCHEPHQSYLQHSLKWECPYPTLARDDWFLKGCREESDGDTAFPRWFLYLVKSGVYCPVVLKTGSWNISCGSTGELIRNTDSWSSPQNWFRISTEPETLVVGSVACVFIGLPDNCKLSSNSRQFLQFTLKETKAKVSYWLACFKPR